MADIGLGNLNFIRKYLISIIMIITTFAASIYAIYLSIRMKKKNEEGEHN